MILEIYSKFGFLECQPMTLQAIENSIPETPLLINEDENETEPVNEDKAKD